MKNFVFLLGILIIFSFRSYAEVTLVLGSETLIGGTSGNTIDVSVTATAPTGYTTGYTLIHIGDSVTQGAFTGDLSANNSSLSDGTYGCWAEQIGILSTHEVTVSVSNIEWVEIDDTPPTLSSNIDSLPSITNDPNLKINVTYFDKNWGSGSIGINASNSFNPPDSSGTNVFDVTLSEGENKFGLAAVDELGNTTTVYDIQNPPITVIYDGTAPTITAIDITPTIASTKVPYKSQDLELKLTFDNEMDKTKTPNVWIICENGGRIDQAPNHPSVWDSSGKIYTCHLTIPYNNGSIIDGDAILNITDFYDKAGNIGANIATSAIPVGSTDLFKIDTTPAKIDIDSAKIDETSLNLTIPITDNVWTKTGGSTKISGSGINKKDGFKLWIDANGDGLGFEDSNSQKEIFTIYDLDDNPTGDKSLTYDGQTLTFYPSLLKSDHPWKVYTAENITVKVILCKDMSGNESIPVSKTIATHLNFKPTSNFVYWDNVNSINAEKTPPNNGTTPDPYQDIQIQFNVNENTKSKLDKSSVVLRINNLRFGLNGSGSADQSPSFIVKESNDTTEILVFSPENAVPPILLKDGKVSVEFSASDEIGQSIDTISTSFDVNTGIPSTTFVYWTDSKTPEKEKTPPQYYQTIQGITPYTDQHIKFQIIPNSTSKIKIDTNEIVLKISFANGPQTNDYFFAPASSDNAYASSAMTFKEITNSTSEAKIIEVDVLPENSTNPLVFPEGEIKAEIVKAQDIYGNNALKTLTSFFVDNTPPSYQPISPLPGQITFDTGEIMGLQAQDTAGQGMGANLKVEITGTTGNPSSGSIEISVTPSDDLKTYNIYLNPNGATYKSPLSNGKCTISGDIHDFLKDNESHKTNVNYSFFCLLNTEITNLQYDEISKEKTTPIIGYISGLTGVDDNTSYLTVVYKINEQSERSQIVYVGPNYQQGDNDKIAPFNINVELESSLNTISFYVADNFGNRSSKIKTITVNWDQSGPASSVLLLDLPSNSKKIFQYNAKFKWSKVEDAKVQKIQIAVDKAMDSIILTKSVGEGITQASVSLLDEPYNTYYAWMTSYDSLGNNSITSNIVSFKMDRTSPKLNTITINDTTPNNNNTPVYPQRINPGDMKITLSFSEDMDTSVDLLTDNRIQLSFPHLKKYLKLEQGSWIADSVWQGTVNPATVPSDPKWSGEFYIEVQDVKDLAGLKMQFLKSTSYYLDTRPELNAPKIFPNPIDEKEIMITISSEEKLSAPPVCMMNTNEKVEMSEHTENTYIGVYRLGTTRIGNANVTFSATDLQGNVGHWPETYDDLKNSTTQSAPRISKLAIEELKTEGCDILSGDNIIKINIPYNSVNKNEIISIIPVSIESNSKYAPLKTMQDDLTIIGEPYNFSYNKKLSKKALVSYKLNDSNISKKGLGIYIYQNNKWNFLGNKIENEYIKAETNNLGMFAVFSDKKAPEIISTTPDNEDEFDSNNFLISTNEMGSGLKKVFLTIDENEYILENENISNNNAHFSPIRKLTSGKHSVAFKAVDNSGNESSPYQIIFYAPGSISINNIIAYPNPCYDNITISYKLNKTASIIKLYVYDNYGDKVYSDTQYNEKNNEFDWDLLNNDGNEISSGIYHYKIKVSDENDDVFTGKISVIK